MMKPVRHMPERRAAVPGAAGVTVQNRQRAWRVNGVAVRALAAFVLTREGVPDAAGITIRLVNDSGIIAFNTRYFGKSTPTDVISFPGVARRTAAAAYVGDVVVSVPQAVRYARAHTLDPAVELARYVIHGVLHCLGYDDLTPRARQRMFTRQEQLLRAWLRQPVCAPVLKTVY
jgi:probable rRNA maturation factor